MGDTNLEDSLAKRWTTMEGKQLITLAVLLGALSGVGGGVGGSMFRVDPFTGSEGAVHESRLDSLEQWRSETQEIINELPPDWFEEDFRELKAELRRVHSANEDLKIELVKISHMLGALQMRGHFSPNDLVSPGLFKEGKSK